MPTILNIFGLRFFFYADEHLPIHVHLENSDGLAKIGLEPEIILIENRGKSYLSNFLGLINFFFGRYLNEMCFYIRGKEFSVEG